MYQRVLDGYRAERHGSNTWVVPDEPYADAFHVRISTDTVTARTAPTTVDLADIRPATDAGNADEGSTTEGARSPGSL